MKKIKLRVGAAVCVASMLSACVHTTPNPVAASQPGDETMSCQTIKSQMSDMTNQVHESDSDGNGQVAKNVALGVAGAFLLVPWFFMDTSDAHSVEGKAAQARYKRLQQYYADKGCVDTNVAAAGAASSPVAASSPH